jgi:hypothetical protein
MPLERRRLCLKNSIFGVLNFIVGGVSSLPMLLILIVMPRRDPECDDEESDEEHRPNVSHVAAFPVPRA